jgi:hypothetical protein
MTEDREPYNFEKDGVGKGLSTDSPVLILEKIESTQGLKHITIFPWIRACI